MTASSQLPKDSLSSRRVTVRDIAEAVGLHFTTVAEALRGSPRIKESTRERITQVAQTMGYRPDPALAALSSYRSSKVRNSFQGVLAWINGVQSNEQLVKEKSFYNDCYRGALERSRFLGYKLELFWIGEPGMTGKRISGILQSRNIMGVVAGPMREAYDDYALEWDKFISVRIGYSLSDSRLTTVISDQFQNTVQAFERIYADGFRRIGFACPGFLDERVHHKFSGAYLSQVFLRFNELPLPMFIDPNPTGGREAFLEWYQKHQPEVILAGGRSIYYKFLMAAGVDVPAQVQFVSTHAEYLRSPVAGISQNGSVVGASAVDHLVSMIQGFKTGLEAYPKTTLVPGRWVDGDSYNPALKRN